jgi:hypothetical protein
VQQTYGNKRTAGNVVVGHRNTVAEVPGFHVATGQRLAVWEFKGGSNERWAFDRTPNRIFVPNYIGMVWDVLGGTTQPSSGTPIQLYPLMTGQANQAFALTDVELRGTGDNCIEALAAAAGAGIELRRCNGASRQKWNVTGGNGPTSVRLAGTALCIASPVSAPTAGQNLVLDKCAAGQRVELYPNAGRLVFGANTSLCLDTEWGDPAGAVLDIGVAPRSLDTYDARFYPRRAGRALQLYTCQATLNQQFHVRGPITGLNGQCVDIAGGTGVNGAPLQVYPCTGNPNQQWDSYIF